MNADDLEAMTASPRRWARLAKRSLRRLRPVELFDAWMFAEAEATLALSAWRSASRAEKQEAYTAYLAALDREAQAAKTLELRLAVSGA